MTLCYTIYMSKSSLSEADFQKTVIELAKLHRWLVYHTHDSRRSAPGFPDLTMVRDGRIIFAELKVGRNNPTESQLLWISELRRCLDDVYLWRPCDWREIEEVLR